MIESERASHFWVAGPPFFSSTIMVASGASDSGAGTIKVSCELFDVDGTPAQQFQVEFPEREVGIIETEPFTSGLKMQGGIVQGHLVVRSRSRTTHICRQQLGEHVGIISAPRAILNREMGCMPMLLGSRREHLVVLLNASPESGSAVIRLLYGTRSPEWTVQIPGNGCRVISVEHELLSSFDDSSWQRGVVQGYLRVSPRAQAMTCQMIERLPGETEQQESFRCVCSW